jgi:formate hydrogenlyase subunit 3/multisubunit Na+/H+ antiporter MnhD subunit
VLIGRFYALVVLLSTALLHCTLRWRSASRGGVWSLAWSVVAAALVWTHYLTVPFVGLCWLAAAWSERSCRRSVPVHVGQLLLAAGITAAFIAPLAPAVQRLSQWSRF